MKSKNLYIPIRLCAAMLAIIASFSAWAAPGTAKEINDIKRSGIYFHAESTAPTQQEATDAATQMLAYYINEYIKDNNLSHPDLKSDNIPGVKYIEATRGANIRVFAYVERNVILGDEISAPVVQTHPQSETIPAEIPPIETIPAETISAETIQEAIADYSIPVIDYSTDESSCSTDEYDISPLMRNYLDAIDKCVEDGEITKVMQTLGRLKAERIVKRYGPANKCPNKTWAYWMIFDSSGKQLEGFLSPGNDGERVNIVTGADYDSLSNYSGANKMALWFEFW